MKKKLTLIKNLFTYMNIKKTTSSILFFLLFGMIVTLSLYCYNGNKNYSNENSFYIKKGSKLKKITVMKAPITNLEQTKDWISESVIELLTYDASNYNSDARHKKIKRILSSDIFGSYWEKEISRIREDISNGYLRMAAITSYPPILLGETTGTGGDKIYKFFMEIYLKQESKFESYPRYYRKKIKIIVKEVDSSESLSGINILRITIK